MKRLFVLIVFLAGCRFMALPESQRDRCANAVHSWHVERVGNIKPLTVPDEIKEEMIVFSRLQESRQLKEVCNIDPPPQVTQKASP